jgi:CheY-like chemotaxis protein
LTSREPALHHRRACRTAVPRRSMPRPYRVALQGFSAFERSALGSYFRLAINRAPAYEQVASAADAHFLVIDADQGDAVRAVQALGRVDDAVFVGAQAPDGASAWMMRPIDPLHVLRELDAMVAARAEPAAAGARPLPGAAGHWPARRSGDFAGAEPVPAAAVPALPRHALLVDDSEIALRFLETRLQRHGLTTARATTSAKAIELLAKQDWSFVFLDVELGTGSDLDGLALCQHIKRHQRSGAGERAPVIAMVSAHHSQLDRVRGTLAGADAYLDKPLDEAALERLLKRHDAAQDASR